jgi:dihydrofolate reductase
MVTLDGFFEGPGRDIDWHTVDEEFNDFAIQQLQSAGGLIFGRITYELMASYWPTLAAVRDDPVIAEMMNSIPKWVFSRTIDQADWNSTTLIKGEAEVEVPKLKSESDKDLLIFGSANLASSLIPRSLIDEFRLMLSPILLGAGTPLFQDLPQKISLRWLKSRTFANGNVLLHYEPAQRDG